MNVQGKVITGDNRDIADGSIGPVVTSPLYWLLKDYGVPLQIGYGQTLREYLLNLSIGTNSRKRRPDAIAKYVGQVAKAIRACEVGCRLHVKISEELRAEVDAITEEDCDNFSRGQGSGSLRPVVQAVAAAWRSARPARSS